MESDAKCIPISEEEAVECVCDAAPSDAAEAPAVATASTMVTLDVCPDTEDVDLDNVAVCVKSGLPSDAVWSGHTLVPIAFGLRKLRITLFVTDATKLDDIVEAVQDLPLVRSVDIYAFQKV